MHNEIRPERATAQVTQAVSLPSHRTATTPEASLHDHVWRRHSFDIRTNEIEYSCDLCLVMWVGPRAFSEREHERATLRRG